MWEKQNNYLCPNACLSQRLFLLRKENFCQAHKTQNILLWHFQKEYFWIDNFTIIGSSRNNWIEKAWRELFFWPRTEWLCFSFTTNDETWLVLDSKTHLLWNCAAFFPSLLCPHGTLSLLPASWPLFSTLCPQTGHVSWANAGRHKEQWRLAVACVTSPNPFKTKMEILFGSQLVLDVLGLSPTFPFISIISAKFLWFLNSLFTAHIASPTHCLQSLLRTSVLSERKNLMHLEK